MLKYEIMKNGSGWIEVTKEEWIAEERACGFKPKLAGDHPDFHKVCATGGFSATRGGSAVEGRIVSDGSDL